MSFREFPSPVSLTIARWPSRHGHHDAVGNYTTSRDVTLDAGTGNSRGTDPRSVVSMARTCPVHALDPSPIHLASEGWLQGWLGVVSISAGRRGVAGVVPNHPSVHGIALAHV